MAFNVMFHFIDEFGRETKRSYSNDKTTVADVITDVGVIAPLFEAVIQGGLTKVSISQADTSDAFVATSPSNIDENASLKVLAVDNFFYDFNLPMPIAALRLAGGSIDTANAALLLLIDEFEAANPWFVNLRNPTNIVSISSGKLDK